jgi:hypothetical protein
MSEENNPKLKKRDKPAFLLVLLVLSGLSLGGGFFGVVSTIISGPSTDDELNAVRVESAKALSESRKDLKDSEGEKAFEVVENMSNFFIERNEYIQKQVFWPYHLLVFLATGIGIVGVFFMFKLKKIGFHLYIIYCLLDVGIPFILFPGELRSSILIILSLSLSALFVFLYSLNLKHFVDAEPVDGSGFKYNN